MLKRICTCLSLAACCLAVQAGVSAAIEPCDVHLAPNLVSIGATYNGGKVMVAGTVPSDAQVIIEVEGKKGETTLLKKEHVLGVVWMNSGSITLSGLPGAYMLYLPSKTAGDTLDTLNIGFNELKQQAAVIPEDGRRSEELEEYFKLKKKEGLYAVHENAVHYQVKNGVKKFSCELLIPAAMHRGTYNVKTSVIKDGTAYTVSNELKLEEAGLPAFIRSMAYNHAVIYGIMATLVAIFAGLLMGFIFQGEKGAH